MKRMIADVLDFTRGRLGGGIPLSAKPTDFGRICHDTVTELRTAHPSRKIVMETSGDVLGVWDPDRIAQVISNLIGNAVQYGIDPVFVRLHGESDEVVLAVNNQCAGEPLPAEFLPQLFDPFRRGAPVEHTHAGLGLGLYIVSEIVRAHGATIEVASSAEEGITFTSHWPRVTVLPQRAQQWAGSW